MEIKAGTEGARRVLNAAVKGSIDILERENDDILKTARCNSGCTCLHWAAGTNQVETIRYLVTRRGVPVDICATKKARGRSPLHYAARNGSLEAAQLLVELGANVNVRAKHGVSPFQLAVWQNNLEICRWLVEEQGVDPTQVNEFDCGAVHWIGICPQTSCTDATGADLLPLAIWLAKQPGIDFCKRQRQGHTPMHKAAWGGHLALLRYLRDEHGLLDHIQDYAGNYAADLADMANTERHAKVALFLRQECNSSRAQSCAVLGLPVHSTMQDIRRAYLTKVREVHPDRQGHNLETNHFDKIRKAYEHLTKEGGNGKQSNPSHSLHLMLELTKSSGSIDLQTEAADDDDKDFFKARLLAVLLEYGDKGLDLSNVKKKWNQVWPDVPFPDENQVSGQKKRGGLLEYIRQKADGVVDIECPQNGIGSIRVIPKCSKSQVAQKAALYS